MDGDPCALQRHAVAAPSGRWWHVEMSPCSGFTQGVKEEVWVCRRLSPWQEQGSVPPAPGRWARSIQAKVCSTAHFTHMQNRCVMIPAFVVVLRLN